MKHSKHQRLLAGLLSIVMMFSMLAPAASAAPVRTAETTAVENMIPADKLTIAAGNQHDNEGQSAQNVLEDDDQIWHTNWNGCNRADLWLSLTIPANEYVVTGLVYVPRSGGGNGNITKYHIEARNSDNEGWVRIASGDWADNGDTKTVTFKGQFYTQYRLVAVESKTDQPDKNFASADQVRLLGHPKTAEENKIVYQYEKIPNGTETQMCKTAQADSKMDPVSGTDGKADWAFDGTNANGWHSRWGGTAAPEDRTSMPYSIWWTMPEATEVGQLGYIRKTNASNGIWRDVTVYGKNAGDSDWFVIDHFGGMRDAGDNNEILLPFTKPVTVTEMKVTVTDSHNATVEKYASAGEINIYKEISGNRPVDPSVPVGEYQRLPQKDIIGTVQASSEETSSEQSPARNAFDNNPGTIWHTRYSSAAPTPHSIQWSVGAAKNLGRIDYVKRPNGGNGELYNVTVLGKNGEGGNWITLADHVAINAGDSRTSIYFKPQQLTDLKVTVNDSKNGFAAAAEFYTYEQIASGKVDKQALRNAYADASEMPTDGYTAESVAALTAALTQADTVLKNENAAAEDVQNAITNLNRAIKDLVPGKDLIAPGAPADENGNKTTGQPFAKGTAGSNQFRIPSIITLKHQKQNPDLNGRLVAAIDARWNHTGDACALDTILSVSDDNGANWTYSFPNFFNDTTNVYAPNGTAFIDPVMVEDQDGTIYMMVDLFPGGVAINTAPRRPARESGYREIDQKDRMILYTVTGETQTADNYTYFVGDFAADESGKRFAPVLDKNEKQTPAYYVDEHYNLYTAEKAPMYCRQIEGGNLNGAKFVQQNVFFYNADLHVRDATYLWVISSKDGGQSWSAPTILNPMVRKDANTDMFYGVGPGAGLSFVDDKGQDVVMLEAYTFTLNAPNSHNQITSFVYSTDKGATWHRAPDATKDGYWSSESALVPIDKTTVRQFYRDGSNNLNYTDFTWNPETKQFTTNATPVAVPGASKTSNNQLSAIKYSEMKDGKAVYLVSTANGGGGSRTDGDVYVLTLEPNKTMKVLNKIDINSGGVKYGYSSLTETETGDIALLYEGKTVDERYGEDIYFQIIPKDQLFPAMENVELKVDETKAIPLTGAFESNSSSDVVKVTVTTKTEGAVQGLIGSSNSFDGGRQELSAGLFTFDQKNGDSYRISGMLNDQKVYMQLNPTGGTAGYPMMGTGEGTMTIENAPGEAGNFYIKNNVSDTRYLFFWKDSNKDCVYDSINKNPTNTNFQDGCTFMLYRPAVEGENIPTDLPGFVKITGLDQLKDGGKYLIVSSRQDQMYVMRPSTANKNDKFSYVMKVDSADFVKTMNLTGFHPGNAQVAANGKVYNVTVIDNDNDPNTLPNRDVRFYAYVDGKLTLMDRRTNLTTYWIGGQQCIPTEVLAEAYGELGFQTSDLKVGEKKFLHANKDEGSIWAEAAKAQDGTIYASTLNRSEKTAIDVVYLPKQTVSGSVGRGDANMIAKETFYTVTNGENVRYFLNGTRAVVTLDNLEGKGWVMTGKDNTVLNGVEAEGKTTFTVDSIQQPYTLTACDKLYGTSMTLKNSLKLEFYIEKNKLPANTDNVYAQVTKTNADGTTTQVRVPYSQWQAKGEQLMYVNFTGVSAKEMQDQIQVQMFDGGRALSAVYTDSIHDYALRQLADETTDAKLKTLLVDMLNYGAACQTEFNYAPDKPANADIDAYQQYATQEVTYKDTSVKGDHFYGSALTTKSNILFTMYFRELTPEMYAEVSFTNHYGQKQTVRIDQFVQRGELYGVEIDELVIADVNSAIECKVYNGEEVFASATDSIQSYVARLEAQGTNTEVCQSIMKFGTSAEAFFKTV